MPDPEPPALLSAAEEKFEYWRCRVGLILGPAAFFLLLAFPIAGLSPEAQRLVPALVLAIIFWITEAIPMAATAFLAPALCVPLGVATQKEILAPFASPSIFMFIGSFFIAEAMHVHGLDRRMALWLLTRRGVTRSPFTLFAAIGCMTALLSMWMSNVATTAMMIPIGLGILATCPGLADKPRVRCNLVLLIAFAASIGGLGTPVGTPPNIITMGFIKTNSGETITFFDWMKAGVPLVIILTAFLLWQLRPKGLTFGDRAALETSLRTQYTSLGPVKPGERNALIIFGLALFLWMWPGLVELVTGQKILGAAWLAKHLPEESVGLLCGLLVFILPVSLKEWRFTLTWQQAVRIDWATIFLFAGGLALGSLIESKGLAKAMGEGMVAWLGTPGPWLLAAAGVVLGLALSEATSNTASATVMVPLMIAVAKGANLPPVPIAIATGLACSFGFMLPVSTGPNALAYGTGHVPLPRMIKSGIFLDIAGAAAIWVTVWAIYR
jgi:sodium-dependent dicarboxylate transporter 2/3/5